MKLATIVGLIVLVLGMAGARAQTVPSTSDSTLVDEALDDYQHRIRYGFLVDPFSIYSSTYGFGIRALATVYNLPFTGSRLRATLAPYQRRGVYALSLRTHDPEVNDVFGLFRVRYETTRAYRYYGLGPNSMKNDQLFVDMDRFEVVARVGFQFAEDRFMIQPFATYSWDKANGLDEGDDPSTLDQRSQDNLAIVLGQVASPSGITDNAQSGVKVGVSLLADHRNRRAYPTAGTLAEITATHYMSRGDFDVSFDQLKFDGHLFVSVAGDHVLAFRALAKTTSSSGNDPVPFYLLPQVDFSLLGGYKGHRLIGDDLLVLTTEYRWPMVNLSDLYQVTGFVQAGVGNVFDDLANMKLSVSFDRNPDPNDHGLRPGFGIGLRVAALEQGRDLIYWMLGFSPEGVTLASFRFVVPLTDI
ncbi:MAG: BamA/TamA family outer membrane protein [Rhodothermales bacterium]